MTQKNTIYSTLRNSRFNKLRVKLLNELDIHTLEVVKKSFASTVVRVLGMAAGLGVSLFLGRTLGAEGLGIINLANRIVQLLLVITMFGMPQVVIKFVAIAYEKKDWQRVGDTLFTATTITGSIALVLTLVGLLITPYLANSLFKEPLLEVPLKITFLLLLPQTLSRIFASSVNGFRKIWQSNLVNETLSMWIISILLIALYFLKADIDVIKAATIYAIGRTTVTLSIIIYWKRLYRFKGKRQWIARPMLKMAMPMLLVMSTGVISANISTIMLGWLGTAEDVGLFSVAARIAMLVSFFLLVTNSAISPKLASLYAIGQKEGMQAMVQKVTKGLTVIAILSLLFFIFLGKPLLGLWGEEFKEAYWVLIILGVGQFVNISTGCSGLLLVMCGYEKIHGHISLGMIIVNLILNYILILKLGIVGVALSTAFILGVENIVKVYYAKRKTKVLTLPFNFKKYGK